jgi:phospholipase/lecithinase/hemolysin
VWPETIGFLLDARVTPFRQGFGGTSQIVGGTGFAMGGSRVSQQPGIDCRPDPQTLACTAALTIPVRQQITDFLDANGDRFAGNQLVFVFAGANDVLYQLGVFGARVQGGVPVALAQADALEAVQQAAVELAAEVHRIVGKGAKRVAVLNLPDLADTIFGRSPEQAQVRPLIAGMVQLFNGTLAAGLRGTNARLVDTYAQFKQVTANPGKFFVSEINVPACDTAKIAAITEGEVTTGTSLFCSLRTLVQNDAPIRYLFADSVHPTTLGHLIIARLVLIELWKQGLL